MFELRRFSLTFPFDLGKGRGFSLPPRPPAPAAAGQSAFTRLSERVSYRRGRGPGASGCRFLWTNILLFFPERVGMIMRLVIS